MESHGGLLRIIRGLVKVDLVKWSWPPRLGLVYYYRSDRLLVIGIAPPGLYLFLRDSPKHGNFAVRILCWRAFQWIGHGA